MVIRRPSRPVLWGGLAALALGAWWWLSRPAAPPGSAAVAAARASKEGAARLEPLPRIALDRLQVQRSAPLAGQRDIFDFAPPPTMAADPVPVPVAAYSPPAPLPSPESLPSGPPPPPPLQVKFVGALERKPGLKVAILMTDRKEILTGQAGEIVANRLRIVAIGHESVDVQDVGSDRVRRIPLKGN